MIHDAKVKVTCDHEDCHESVIVDLRYVYWNMDDSSGHYDTSEDAIKKTLKKDHDWIVRDDEHFCSTECEAGA